MDQGRGVRRSARQLVNILLVTEALVAGGAETFVLRLANALSERHQVTLAILHGHKAEPALLDQVAQAVRIERLSLPAYRWQWRADTLLRRLGIDRSLIRSAQGRWLSRLAARTKAEVIHSHLLKADRLASEIAERANGAIRHVVTLHGDYAPYLEGQADPFMLDAAGWIGRICQSASAVVAVCRQHLDHFLADFPAIRGKLHLIYNGYELPEPGGSDDPSLLPQGRFLIGMVSRGVEQKGWDTAVAAFSMLERDDAALVLVGDGPAIDRLRAQGPAGVVFAGFSPRPTDWIRHFDLCLLPTRFPHESLPTVVIEYLASAKPVIATAVGEIPTMLQAPDGEVAGMLLDFDGKNVDAGALCSAMRALIDDAPRRSAMAAAAKKAAGRFAMEHCLRDYEALYRGETPSASRPSTSASH